MPHDSHRFQGVVLGIRSLVAAAAVVVTGVGAADAAVYDYTFKVRFDGTIFNNVELHPADGSDNLVVDAVNITRDIYGIPTLFPGLEVGDITKLDLTLFRPDDAEDGDIYLGNGGYALTCKIGHLSCPGFINWVDEKWGKYIKFGDTDDHTYQGLMEVGETYFFEYFPNGFDFFPTNPDYTYGEYQWADTSFTIIAPIPLPASAALLPLGLGALAMMRKRRRSAA